MRASRWPDRRWRAWVGSADSRPSSPGSARRCARRWPSTPRGSPGAVDPARSRAVRGTPGRRAGPRRCPSPGSGPSATVEIDPRRIGAVRMTYSPSTDGAPDPGEVVWTWVPFEERDGRGKDRPVLVVAAETQRHLPGRAADVEAAPGQRRVRADRLRQLGLGRPAVVGEHRPGVPGAPGRHAPGDRRAAGRRRSPRSRPGCASGTAGTEPSRRRPCSVRSWSPPQPAVRPSVADDGAGGAPLGAGAGVQADRGGTGQVQRLGAAVDRHPHGLVGARDRRRPAARAPRSRTARPSAGRGCRRRRGVQVELGARRWSPARTARRRPARRAGQRRRRPGPPAGGTGCRRTPGSPSG